MGIAIGCLITAILVLVLVVLICRRMKPNIIFNNVFYFHRQQAAALEPQEIDEMCIRDRRPLPPVPQHPIPLPPPPAVIELAENPNNREIQEENEANMHVMPVLNNNNNDRDEEPRGALCVVL